MVLIAACGSGGGYHVSVERGGKTLRSFDLTALHALPEVTVDTSESAGKKEQRGPLVRTVLARAGVHEFSRLRVVGQSGSQTLTAAEIDDQVVLDFNNRGTVKLAGPHLPRSQWVTDVTELDIE